MRVKIPLKMQYKILPKVLWISLHSSSHSSTDVFLRNTKARQASFMRPFFISQRGVSGKANMSMAITVIGTAAATANQCQFKAAPKE